MAVEPMNSNNTNTIQNPRVSLVGSYLSNINCIVFRPTRQLHRPMTLFLGRGPAGLSPETTFSCGVKFVSDELSFVSFRYNLGKYYSTSPASQFFSFGELTIMLSRLISYR